ncbi:LamGL domain-containing protein [Sandaracinus amylolyticus]|nr:LamGL domain-containing protein [Sandaracinus amylolyticus]
MAHRLLDAAPVRARFLCILTALALGACAGGNENPRGTDGAIPGRDAAASDGGTPGQDEDGGAPGCEAAPPSRALAFDGTDDGASMGAARPLGLARFTVEAWVRRDGPGVATGTGVGGLSIVPIAGKGRGEDDGSNVDCNYAFGFVGDVLGADFEDMATGANHPVVGRTRVASGEWHHVAVTYDGTTWRLYLDGALDGSARANATPRADSIQHFGIGTALDSMGRAAGRLHGAVSELRVWDRARTADEIAGARFERVASGEGLLARWALDGDGTDTIGDLDATITGATFVETGPVLDRGLPPTITGTIPSDALEVTGDSVELSVGATDFEGEELDVTFHLRALGEDDGFTIVVLPDTQYYTVDDRNLEQFFYDQTQWIVDNHDAYDIRAVIHNGDLVNNGDSQVFQWRVADRAMTTLEAALPGMPDGMPYGVAVGNHDLSVVSQVGPATRYNEFFGVDRFEGRAYYGGHYGSTNDEHWFTFSAGGMDFVVVDMKYDPAPDAAVLAWARRILETHPDHFGIVNAHYIVNSDGTFGAQGQAIYNALRSVQNLHLMTCGHISAESRRNDTFEGHRIDSMLADYQSRENGGNGFMRIWEFSPAEGELTVRTYSPTHDRWETDANSEFTLRVPLRGAGGAFEEVARAERGASPATATIDGLEPGRVYEWYATIRDCDHTVRTPVSRFTTTP